MAVNHRAVANGASPLQRFRSIWSKISRVSPKERVYIIPTWYCLLFNALLMWTITYGFFSHSLMIFSAAIVVVFIELLSMIEAHVNLRDMSLEAEMVPAMEAGSAGTLKVRATSLSRSFGVQVYAMEARPIVPSNEAQHLTPKGIGRFFRSDRPQWSPYMRHEMAQALCFWKTATATASGSEFSEYSLTPKMQILSVRLLAERRGIYEVPGIVAVSMFPFGFFRVWRQFKVDGRLVVYPRQSGQSYLAASVPQRHRDQESKQSLHSGAGEKNSQTSRPVQDAASEYREHRVFGLGDSLHRIDWKASSRRRMKMVKVFVGGPTREQRILRWNETTVLHPELRLEQLCLWVHEAAHAYVPFALELPGVQPAFGAGDVHKQYCLRLLAGYDLQAATGTVAA